MTAAILAIAAVFVIFLGFMSWYRRAVDSGYSRLPLFDLRRDAKVQPEGARRKAPADAFRDRPTAGDVARRLLILHTLLMHCDSWRQHAPRASGAPESKALMRRPQTAAERLLKRHGLWSCATAAEQDFLSTTPRADNAYLADAFAWSIEALAVIAWALGLCRDLPPFDRGADAQAAKEVPVRDFAHFIAESRLAPAGIIDSKREAAELWHWRSRVRQALSEGTPTGTSAATLEEAVASAARTACENGDVAEVLQDDFACRGKAYRELPDEEWREVSRIACERYRALNWLCGRAPENRWDLAPIDTDTNSCLSKAPDDSSCP